MKMLGGLVRMGAKRGEPMVAWMRIVWTCARMVRVLWPVRVWRYGVSVAWPTFPIVSQWRRAWECIGHCSECGELCTGSEPYSTIGAGRRDDQPVLVITCSRCTRVEPKPLLWWQKRWRAAMEAGS